MKGQRQQRDGDKNIIPGWYEIHCCTLHNWKAPNKSQAQCVACRCHNKTADLRDIEKDSKIFSSSYKLPSFITYLNLGLFSIHFSSLTFDTAKTFHNYTFGDKCQGENINIWSFWHWGLECKTEAINTEVFGNFQSMVSHAAYITPTTQPSEPHYISCLRQKFKFDLNVL